MRSLAAKVLMFAGLASGLYGQSRSLTLCDQTAGTGRHCFTYQMPASVSSGVTVTGISPFVSQGFLVTGHSIAGLDTTSQGLHVYYDSGIGHVDSKDPAITGGYGPMVMQGYSFDMINRSGNVGASVYDMQAFMNYGNTYMKVDSTGVSLLPDTGSKVWTSKTIQPTTNGVDLGASSQAFQFGYIYEPVVNYLAFIDSTPAVKATVGYDSSDGTITMVNNISQKLWSWAVAGQVMSYSTVLPSATNSWELGSTSLRWNKAWLKDLDISGTCTGCPGSSALPLAGGTMTGNILVSGNHDLGSSTNAWQYAYIYQPIINYLAIMDSTPALKATLGYDSTLGVVSLVNNISTHLWTWSLSGLATSYGAIVPDVTNTRDLGGSSLRWANLYSTTGTFSTLNATTNLFGTAAVATGLNLGYSTGGGTQCLQVDNSGNVTASGAGCAAGSYLPLSGGNMSGTIGAHDITPTSNTTWNSGSASFKWAGVYSNAVYMYSDSYTNYGGSGQVQLGSSEWAPLTNNWVSLGDSTHRFAAGYFNSVIAQPPTSVAAGGFTANWGSGGWAILVANSGSGGLGIVDTSVSGSSFQRLYLSLSNTPTSCTGQPSGTVAALSGILALCP